MEENPQDQPEGEQPTEQPDATAQEPQEPETPGEPETPAPKMFDSLGPEHLGLQMFASTDATRPFLVGLCIRDGKVCATDGGVAIMVPTEKTQDFPLVPGMGEPLDPKKDYVVPPKSIEKGLRLASSKSMASSMPILSRVIASYDPQDETHVLLSGSDLEVEGTLRTRIIQGKYPSFEQIMPDPEAAKATIALGASYLKKVAEYALKYGVGAGAHVVLMFYGPLSPVRFEIRLRNEGEAIGALAPVRVYGSGYQTFPKLDVPQDGERKTLTKEEVTVLQDLVTEYAERIEGPYELPMAERLLRLFGLWSSEWVERFKRVGSDLDDDQGDGEKPPIEGESPVGDAEPV